jgi:site-specific DNA recombinase
MKRCATRSRSTDVEPTTRFNGTTQCAIYTRKSTEEGLEQEFNSLDAQRESAEAYILKHSISFVSVTQQFNTTDSMGRLTLNILLSFAQFEREIISERTRDKMCAARRKGKWVGGHPVLGNDVHPQGGRLVVNPDEAARVRAIYQLYLEHQAMIPVVHELQRRGWTAKHWTTKKGRELGGRSFSKAGLFRLLTNTIYTGNVDFQGTIYNGEHEAIIDTDTWLQIQDTLRRNGRSGGKRVRNKYGALLIGYDGRDGKVTVTFHSPGIKALCSETG